MLLSSAAVYGSRLQGKRELSLLRERVKARLQFSDGAPVKVGQLRLEQAISPTEDDSDDLPAFLLQNRMESFSSSAGIALGSTNQLICTCMTEIRRRLYLRRRPCTLRSSFVRGVGIF
jgi:hypothetical protein